MYKNKSLCLLVFDKYIQPRHEAINNSNNNNNLFIYIAQ